MPAPGPIHRGSHLSRTNKPGPRDHLWKGWSKWVQTEIDLELHQYEHFEKSELEALFETPLALSGIIIPDRKSAEGLLIRSTSFIWTTIVDRLRGHWPLAYDIPADKWEEIIAGAFKKAGYDEVTLTPRSGDYGRDVIAVRKGFGCIKIIGSVKAYKPGHLVKHDDVRALLGVLSGELDASKGIITTTSEFAPKIKSDPFIKPFFPTRLELVNGVELQKWLMELAEKK